MTPKKKAKKLYNTYFEVCKKHKPTVKIVKEVLLHSICARIRQLNEKSKLGLDFESTKVGLKDLNFWQETVYALSDIKKRKWKP